MPAWFATICLAMLSAQVAAQNVGPGSAPPSHYAPVTARPPQALQPAAAPLRLAPRTGAGKQPLVRPATPSVSSALGTVVGSLGVVLGLFLVIAWCSRRFSPTGALPLPKEAVELLGQAPLAGRQQMRLLRVGNKLLLVALSPAGIETLTEITDAAEVEHLTALCRRSRPGSSQAAFQQVLTQLATDPRESDAASRTLVRGAR
jgi:flagellar biogenesis protein FliO